MTYTFILQNDISQLRNLLVLIQSHWRPQKYICKREQTNWDIQIYGCHHHARSDWIFGTDVAVKFTRNSDCCDSNNCCALLSCFFIDYNMQWLKRDSTVTKTKNIDSYMNQRSSETWRDFHQKQFLYRIKKWRRGIGHAVTQNKTFKLLVSRLGWECIFTAAIENCTQCLTTLQT